MKKLFGIITAAALLLAPAAFAQDKLPVFPGAMGYGTDTIAGRGGQIYKVTNLNSSGSGSLRACAEASGPRVCIFEVGGDINIGTDEIDIRNDNLTIAGQTAPSPGITIRGRVDIHASNVLMQHIRVRWTFGGDEDVIGIVPNGRNQTKVVLDHVSVSGGTDENLSLYACQGCKTLSDVTIMNTLNAYPSSPYRNSILGNRANDKASSIRNLYAHGDLRAPTMGGGSSRTEAINDLQYNFPNPPVFIFNDNNGLDVDAQIINTHTVEGPDAEGESKNTVKIKSSKGNSSRYGSVYVSGNICRAGGDCVENNASSSMLVDTPTQRMIKEILPAEEVFEHVLANVGARPADRDSFDATVIQEVRNGTGRIGDPPNVPTLDRTERTLNVPANPHEDDDGDGYTNLENWLHAFSREVEGKDGPPPPVNNPPTLTIAVDALEVEEGTPITFTANAQDVEDGDLGRDVVWSTGDVGRVIVKSFPVGSHTVTAEVSDEEGASVAAGVVVTVNEIIVDPPDPGNHTHEDLVVKNNEQDALLESLFNNVTDLANNQQVIDQRVADLGNDVDNLDARVSNLGDIVGDLEELINSVAGDVNQNKSDIVALNAQFTALVLKVETEISELSDRVQALEDVPPGSDPHATVEICLNGECRTYWVDVEDAGDGSVGDGADLGPIEERLDVVEEDVSNLQNSSITNSASIRNLANKF